MAYSVRVSAAADAQEVLVRLWRRNLQMRGNPEDKHRWFYLSNPLGEAIAGLIESTDDQGVRTVGCCGLGARILYIDGEPRRTGLLADFAVDQDHRTVLPALLLQRALFEHARQHFDLTYAFPNESAVGILGRVGLPLLGRMGRYVNVLRSAEYVARYVKPARLAGVAGALVDSTIVVREAARRIAFPRQCNVEWLTDVDERFDELWERARAQHACIGERNQRFLRWRFTARPGLPAAIAALVEAPSNRLRAYAVIVEKEAGVALVADFLAASHGDLRALLGLLATMLRRRRFKTAVLFFLGAPAVGAAIASAGFAFRHPAKFVVMGTGKSPLLDSSKLFDVANWYVTEADRDN